MAGNSCVTRIALCKRIALISAIPIRGVNHAYQMNDLEGACSEPDTDSFARRRTVSLSEMPVFQPQRASAHAAASCDIVGSARDPLRVRAL